MSLLDRLRGILPNSRKEGRAEAVVMLIPPNGTVLARERPVTTIQLTDQIARNDQFLRQFRIALEVAASRAGESYNSPYILASELAWRGKDPRKALERLRSPGTDITTSLSNASLPPSAQDFVDSALRETARLMSERMYTRQAIAQVYTALTQPQQAELRDAMRAGFDSFIKTRYARSPQRENKILRTYDTRRNDDNITTLLEKAQAKARAGDIEKTVDVLTQVERKACGDWTPEIFDTLRTAYQTNFDYMTEKAERAFTKHQPERGMRYLQRAEQHAREIGLPFRANRPATVEHYLHTRAFATYEDALQLRARRAELISVLHQRH